MKLRALLASAMLFSSLWVAAPASATVCKPNRPCPACHLTLDDMRIGDDGSIEGRPIACYY